LFDLSFHGGRFEGFWGCFLVARLSTGADAPHPGLGRACRAAGLAPAQSGVLYSFKATGTDGNVPVAGLIFNSNGALFGTTSRHHSADRARLR
jgi:hypothetical protein